MGNKIMKKQNPDPLKAIKKYCIECCEGSKNEVILCPSDDCVFWPFRKSKKCCSKGVR